MKTAYTYTVLRYVHDTATGEFVNVGVALYARDALYASAQCRTTYGRLSKTFPGMDGENFKNAMHYVQSRLEELGESIRSELPFENRPQSVMDIAHQVLPPDDSALQWSPVGSGLTEDPSRTLEALYERLVNRYDERPQQERRSDEDVWRKYRRNLETRHVLNRLQPKTIAVADDEIEFRYAWQNGVWHCLEPVSFDLSSGDSIREKAHRVLGQMSSVQGSSDKFKLYLLLGEPQMDSLRPAFDKAISILGKVPGDKEIVRENDAAAFSDHFAKEMAELAP